MTLLDRSIRSFDRLRGLSLLSCCVSVVANSTLGYTSNYATCATGLDTSGEDTDGFAMLPATAVQRLEPPPHVLAQAPDTPAFYLCLGADNKRVLSQTIEVICSSQEGWAPFCLGYEHARVALCCSVFVCAVGLPLSADLGEGAW